MRHAWSGLRRELEAAADDEAARVTGTGPVLSALARTGLALYTPRGAVAGFGDSGHLRYRIAWLQAPRPPGRSPGASTLVTAGGITLITAFTWLACALAIGAPDAAGAAACAAALAGAALAGAALRPLWPSRLSRAGTARCRAGCSG